MKRLEIIAGTQLTQPPLLPYVNEFKIAAATGNSAQVAIARLDANAGKDQIVKYSIISA